MPNLNLTSCLVALVVLSVFVGLGCKRPDGGSGGAATRRAAPLKPPAQVVHTVALMGDSTRTDLLGSIASAFGVSSRSTGDQRCIVMQRGNCEYRLIAADDDRAPSQARVAFQADLAILAVDATQGPLPIHREHMLLARQMGVPELRVALTRSHLVDDPQLLELEELELRELLNLYAMNGDNARFAHDSTKSKAPQNWSGVRGPTQLVDALVGISARTPTALAPARERSSAELYVLATKEAFTPSVAATIQSGRVTMLIGDEQIAVQLNTSQPIAPGGVGRVEFVFPAPVQHPSAQRFVLVREHHIAAAGVLCSDAAPK
ncbi:MAG: GTP-binding protein [Tepidisphaerales bacterium]